jgi:hypothetical protein
MTAKTVLLTVIFLAVIGFALLGFAQGCGVELSPEVAEAVSAVFNPLREATAKAWQ